MPGPPRKFNTELSRTIIDRYIAGESANAIALSLELAVSTVRRTIKRAGVPTHPNLVRRPITPQQEELAVTQLLGGATIDEMVKTVGVSNSTLTRTLRRYQIKLGRGRRPRLCTLDESVFDEITPVSARWMGFLFADGCLPRVTEGQQAISMSIGAKDRGHVEKFRAFLKSNHAIVEMTLKERVIDKRYAASPSISAVHFKVRSNHLVEALVRHGMQKSPERVPGPELENLPAFWAGVVDGDGWLGTDKDAHPYIGLCGHMPLLLKFQKFIADRDITECNITPTQSGIFRIQMSWKPALKLIEILYTKESNEAGLERKVLRAQQILRGEAVTLYEEPVVANDTN